MGRRTSPWTTGIPCWVDLTTPDMATTRAFYTEVLGWNYQIPAGDYGGYVMAETGGAAVAGIGPQPTGAPAAWTLYLASNDADATARAVAAHGGQVLVEPGDVGALGRMFIAADPTGAAFGVWQAGTHIGAGAVNRPGAMAWEDLRSPDPGAARSFYSQVFGYRMEPQPGAGSDYQTFGLAGEDVPVGGIGGLVEAEGGAAHWVVYFAVTSTDGAVAAAEHAGGGVTSPPTDSPFGRMAELTDPWGARFWVAETNPADAPDRSG